MNEYFDPSHLFIDQYVESLHDETADSRLTTMPLIAGDISERKIRFARSKPSLIAQRKLEGGKMWYAAVPPMTPADRQTVPYVNVETVEVDTWYCEFYDVSRYVELNDNIYSYGVSKEVRQALVGREVTDVFLSSMSYLADVLFAQRLRGSYAFATMTYDVIPVAHMMTRLLQYTPGITAAQAHAAALYHFWIANGDIVAPGVTSLFVSNTLPNAQVWSGGGSYTTSILMVEGEDDFVAVSRSPDVFCVRHTRGVLNGTSARTAKYWLLSTTPWVGAYRGDLRFQVPRCILMARLIFHLCRQGQGYINELRNVDDYTNAAEAIKSRFTPRLLNGYGLLPTVFKDSSTVQATWHAGADALSIRVFGFYLANFYLPLRMLGTIPKVYATDDTSFEGWIQNGMRVQEYTSLGRTETRIVDYTDTDTMSAYASM